MLFIKKGTVFLASNVAACGKKMLGGEAKSHLQENLWCEFWCRCHGLLDKFSQQEYKFSKISILKTTQIKKAVYIMRSDKIIRVERGKPKNLLTMDMEAIMLHFLSKIQKDSQICYRGKLTMYTTQYNNRCELGSSASKALNLQACTWIKENGYLWIQHGLPQVSKLHLVYEHWIMFVHQVTSSLLK